MIEIRFLHAFNDNYIWLLHARGCVAVVDPGDAVPVLDYLERSGDRLCAILATHHHGDHVGGVEEILARFPVPVFGPALENIPGVSHPLAGGERIEVPQIGLELKVISVPGHTRGHIAYYGPSLGSDGAVFCGDTLFGAGCGRLFEGTPAQMQESLARLAALPASTLVYCAHEYTQSNLRFALAVEPNSIAVQRRCEEVDELRAAGCATIPTSIQAELETNPFLRWDEPVVRAAAASRLGHVPVDAVETFAAIREWKNRF
ncbi:MAG: hydroxyacylglutathione hydrolase [Sulfuritalea sp.]|nr:hydroxyacylglutathione hydrolase [Sulfuritalea sp.]